MAKTAPAPEKTAPAPEKAAPAEKAADKKPKPDAAQAELERLLAVPITDAQIGNWFQYHKPNEEQAEKYERIRKIGGVFAQTIKAATPNGEDQRRAIALVREAVMWANASIACSRR